jgi:hypothetical protein
MVGRRDLNQTYLMIIHTVLVHLARQSIVSSCCRKQTRKLKGTMKVLVMSFEAITQP